MSIPNIRFKPNLIPLISSGKKVLTYRKGNKYAGLEVGDIIPFVDSGINEEVGTLRITEKYYIPFKELPFDVEGHEKYDSKQHQREVFESYYGSIDDDEPMLVLRFELVK